MAVKSKASARGGVLGANGIIDIDACSNALKATVQLDVAAPATTQNTTTISDSIPIPHANGVQATAAYVVWTTVPAAAGATATINIRKRATDGTTLTDLFTAVSVLGRSSRVAVSLGTPVAGVTIAQGETVEAYITCSNNAVSQAGAGGQVILLATPVEATVVDQ